jgi:hypothetical protein
MRGQHVSDGCRQVLDMSLRAFPFRRATVDSLHPTNGRHQDARRFSDGVDGSTRSAPLRVQSELMPTTASSQLDKASDFQDGLA